LIDRGGTGNWRDEESTMDIRTIGIIGAGQMGGGIAQVGAQAGLGIILYDVAPKMFGRALDAMEKSLVRMKEKGKLRSDLADVIGRVRTTSRFEDLAGADLVIEAAPEDLAIKKDVFQRLDRACRPEVILASNTSSISLTELGATTERPAKVIGMHFMNPPVVLQLVEIVRGLATSDETCDTVRALAERMGKVTILAKDYAGFIVNRILLPMINEAIYAVYEGVGSVEDIDSGMKLGTNQPMGPLALADLIGLDTCLAILERLHTSLGEDKYRPCPLLRNYVAAGYLGRKAGKGFYPYA
jgi:3-hydroxybutyryl-CoA dehydrogenase